MTPLQRTVNRVLGAIGALLYGLFCFGFFYVCVVVPIVLLLGQQPLQPWKALEQSNAYQWRGGGVNGQAPSEIP